MRNIVYLNTKIYIEPSIEAIKDMAEKYLINKQIYCIVDKKVQILFNEKLTNTFPGAKFLPIDANEGTKSLSTVESLYSSLLGTGCDRSSFIIGIGGGITLDIAGFVASTYYRGVPFGYIATTLLAQADASIGGKNGVNFGRFKNIIGTINQPRFVFCPLDVLSALPLGEILNGLAECIKHSLIASNKYFDFLENKFQDLLRLEPTSIVRTIAESAAIKSEIIAIDERESGIRKILNFGHTLGHAIESAAGISHGLAVASGMKFAADLSVKISGFSPEDNGRIQNLLKNFAEISVVNIENQSLIEAFRKDKKKNADTIDFILLNNIGEPAIYKFSFAELESETVKYDFKF
ncbi:MAG: 3-dehydroquinate synthase [Bacteroidota bacterium]|nr:3-dehydroquinate synthase [Bacteroidota bacterium]